MLVIGALLLLWLDLACSEMSRHFTICDFFLDCLCLRLRCRNLVGRAGPSTDHALPVSLTCCRCIVFSWGTEEPTGTVLFLCSAYASLSSPFVFSRHPIVLAQEEVGVVAMDMLRG